MQLSGSKPYTRFVESFGGENRKGSLNRSMAILLKPNVQENKRIWILIEMECRNDRGVYPYWRFFQPLAAKPKFNL